MMQMCMRQKQAGKQNKQKKNSGIAFDSCNTNIILSLSGLNKDKEYCGLLYILCRKQDVLNFENTYFNPHNCSQFTSESAVINNNL